jgi:hypothetical protein
MINPVIADVATFAPHPPTFRKSGSAITKISAVTVIIIQLFLVFELNFPMSIRNMICAVKKKKIKLPRLEKIADK